MNCPMCGMTTDVTGLAHTCAVVLGPATFTPTPAIYAENAKLRAEVEFQASLYRDASAARDKHWKALQDANLQVEEYRKFAGTLAQNVHDLRTHVGSFPFCMQEPCYEAFQKLYGVRPIEKPKYVCLGCGGPHEGSSYCTEKRKSECPLCGKEYEGQRTCH